MSFAVNAAQKFYTSNIAPMLNEKRSTIELGVRVGAIALAAFSYFNGVSTPIIVGVAIIVSPKVGLAALAFVTGTGALYLAKSGIYHSDFTMLAMSSVIAYGISKFPSLAQKMEQYSAEKIIKDFCDPVVKKPVA